MSPDFAQSFNASDWAKAFVEHVKAKPEIATDEATMIGWFANAIMRGYDERARQEPERQAMMRRCLEQIADVHEGSGTGNAADTTLGRRVCPVCGGPEYAHRFNCTLNK